MFKKVTIESHVVSLYPPNDQRPTWLSTCSQKDFSKTFFNRVEALIEANNHVTNVILNDELEKGKYQFATEEL